MNPSFPDTWDFAQYQVPLSPLFLDDLAASCLWTKSDWSYPAVLCHTCHVCLTRYCLCIGFQYQNVGSQTLISILPLRRRLIIISFPGL